MTKDQALALADRILLLVNAQARTPTREEIADLIHGEIGPEIELSPEAYHYPHARTAQEMPAARSTPTMA